MTTRNKVAEDLLKIKAVQFSLNPAFTWASGWRSPIYCDNRKTLSHPEVRTFIRDAFVEQVRAEYPEATGIAGVATGAIAQGALVADQLGLPFIYIRSKAKGHGMQNLIEGALDPAGKYVVIEDLISTGMSSARAVSALLETGATVLGTLAIFSYGFPKAKETFNATGTSFDTLTNMQALMEEAQKIDYLRPEEKAVIESWQQAPDQWQPTEG